MEEEQVDIPPEFGTNLTELNEQMVGFNDVINQLNEALTEMEDFPLDSNPYPDLLDNCIKDLESNPDLPINPLEEVEIEIENQEDNIQNENIEENINVETMNIKFNATTGGCYIVSAPKTITLGELVKRFLRKINREKKIPESEELFNFVYSGKTFNINSNEIVGDVIKDLNNPVIVYDLKNKLAETLVDIQVEQ